MIKVDKYTMRFIPPTFYHDIKIDKILCAYYLTFARQKMKTLPKIESFVVSKTVHKGWNTG